MFVKTLSKNTGTVKLLDDFDKSGEEYLKLMDVFYIREENNAKDFYYLNLFISHKNLKRISSHITMSNLKEVAGTFIRVDDIIEINSLDYQRVPKMSLPMYHFLFHQKEAFLNAIHTMQENNIKESGIIPFEPAIALNAQNSSNRTGYGNEYHYDNLVYAGTLYGETTEYIIEGFQLEKN